VAAYALPDAPRDARRPGSPASARIDRATAFGSPGSTSTLAPVRDSSRPVSLSRETAATIGRPARRYGPSLLAMLISPTSGLWLTRRISAASSSDSYLPACEGGRKSTCSLRRTDRCRRLALSLPSPANTTRSESPFSWAAVSTIVSNPCLYPRLPAYRQTTSVSAQPRRCRVSSLLSAGRVYSAQL